MTTLLILSLFANCVLGAYLWHYVRRAKYLLKYCRHLEDSLRAQMRGIMIGAVVGIGAAILRRIFAGNDGSGENGA